MSLCRLKAARIVRRRAFLPPEREMRDLYYADQRDLVKWAVLVHIAHLHGLRSIIQVPYWRAGRGYHFTFGGVKFPINKEVWNFFRDMRQIVRLGEKCGVSIEVIMEPFNHQDRDGYSDLVSRHLQKCNKRPALLFLDPDTGLTPQRCSPAHVIPKDIKNAWSGLRPNEFLVIYQHAPRQYQPDRYDNSRKRLSEICDHASVDVACSDEIGKDVVFLCIQKPNGNQRLSHVH